MRRGSDGHKVFDIAVLQWSVIFSSWPSFLPKLHSSMTRVLTITPIFTIKAFFLIFYTFCCVSHFFIYLFVTRCSKTDLSGQGQELTTPLMERNGTNDIRPTWYVTISRQIQHRVYSSVGLDSK